MPADDVGMRMRRHFPTLAPVTVPHEDDNRRFGQLFRAKAIRQSGTGRPSVCVVGAIGVHKGYDVLLACARDAERRDLDLEFVVVGHTIDDDRMMADRARVRYGTVRSRRGGRSDCSAARKFWLRSVRVPGNLVSGPWRSLAGRVAGRGIRHRRAGRANKTDTVWNCTSIGPIRKCY